MNVYIAPRQTGKTTMLVKMSAETGAIIVVPTYPMIKHVEDIAKDLGLEIPKPIDCFRFMRELHSFARKRYLVDELQTVLDLMGIEAATLNIDSALVSRVESKGEKKMMDIYRNTWNNKKCQGCWYNYEKIGICMFGDPGIPDDQKRNCEPEDKGENGGTK